MSTFYGNNGSVRVGANTIAEVTAFDISHSSETIETTSMGDATKTFMAAKQEWSGSITCHWDDTDTNGQMALDPGSTISELELYPEGTAAGAYKLSGDAIVTERSVSVSHDGVVEASISFQGTGALTEGVAV